MIDLFGIYFAVLILILLIGFIIFDKILRFEYENHREIWEEDKKPIGILWVPDKASVLYGSYARNSLAIKWLFKNPQWAEHEREVIKWLYWYRRLTFVFFAGVIIQFLIELIKWLVGNI